MNKYVINPVVEVTGLDDYEKIHDFIEELNSFQTF